MPPLQPKSRSRGVMAGLCAVLIFWGGSFATVAATGTTTAAAEPGSATLDQLRLLFRRPAALAAPGGAEAAQVALGARLFREAKLSADQTMSCATCHDPARSFVDGRKRARGNAGQDLPRNTPALWNLSRARAFYWDGRSPTLEAQIKDAIERQGEMAGALEEGVQRLSREASYTAAFQQAFPVATAITGEQVLAAIAAYERTLVSPVTRFDRWVAGRADALTTRELAGLQMFTGKGRCLACHGGWRFTDDGFHDIGLRSTDQGRDQGRAALVGGSGRAFKTPSLRESVWTAPYMHDGSLLTLDDVVAHYGGKLERRQSLAPELKRRIDLSRAERGDLVAFLKTLSSPSRPRATPVGSLRDLPIDP
jgi:cytochrome c peroxidase